MRLLWESTQKARRAYRCDFCEEFITRGNTYSRQVWAYVGQAQLTVLYQHLRPDCPPSHHEEVLEESRVAFCVPIAMEVRVKELVILQANGDILLTSETEVVPVLTGTIENLDENTSPDDEVPF